MNQQLRVLVSFFSVLAAFLIVSYAGNGASEVSAQGMHITNPHFKVLIVHSYHPGYEWVDGINRGIEKAFEETEVEKKVLYMDTKRNPDFEWKVKAGHMALAEMAEFDPDVVLAVDDNAQEYFAKKLVGKDRPQVVFCGVNANASSYGYPAANVTGVLERPFFTASLHLLKSIVPDVQTVAVIGDDSETTKAMYEFMKQQETPLEVIAYEQVHTFDEWKQFIQKYQQEADAIGFAIYHTVKDTLTQKIIEPEDVMAWTVRNLRKPTVSFFDFGVEQGVLCAVAESAEEQGLEAGKMVIELLAGKKAKDIPVTTGQQEISMINLETARKLELTIPDELLDSMDRIIKGFSVAPHNYAQFSGFAYR